MSLNKKRVIGLLIGMLLVVMIISFIVKEKPCVDCIDYTDEMFIAQVDDSPLNYALSFYGIDESFTNGKPNTLVSSFFEDFVSVVLNPRTTAWCSAFMNTVAASTGYEYSGKLDARSWLKVGKSVKTPKPGDVVVLWRDKKDSWKGHVGMFIGWSQDKRYIYVLGGNQGNKVSIAPYETSRLLSFRRLSYIRVPSPTERYETPINLTLE